MLLHLTENRQVEACKLLIFQDSMVGFCLKNARCNSASLRAMQGVEMAQGGATTCYLGIAGSDKTTTITREDIA